MNEIAWGCGLFACLATLLHFASASLATYRSRRGADEPSVINAPPADLPPISVLRPVRGLDPYDELTLRSGFELAYERYELILCCEDADDAIVPVIRRLIAEYPHVDAKLLVGRDTLTSNPKLNNLIKGWRAASHAWVVMADSNVLMPRDYLQRLLPAGAPIPGFFCAPPIGCMPDGFWAEVECAFLNTYQARWQYAADTVGLGFAQGKTMLWRRADLERSRRHPRPRRRDCRGRGGDQGGAPRRQARAPRRSRLRPAAGVRSAGQIWSRQVRWAKLRRATFPVFFLPEVLSGACAPLLAAAYAAEALDVSGVGVAAALGAVWYGCEALLARAAGWHMSALSPLAWVARDLMLPVLWVQAWLGNSFSWRGNDMHLADAVASS